MSDEKWISVEKLDGGYLVQTDKGRHITTSLNKAFSTAKSYIGGDSVDGVVEETKDTKQLLTEG